MLTFNTSLRHLGLAYLLPTDEDSSRIALALASNRTLETLDLSWNDRIAQLAAVDLVKILERPNHKSALRDVRMHRTNLSLPAAMRLQGLSLDKVDMRVNDWNTPDIAALLARRDWKVPYVCLPDSTASQSRQITQSMPVLVNKVGREAVLVYSRGTTVTNILDAYVFWAEHLRPPPPDIVPGCVVLANEAGTIVDLLRKHSQLRRVWLFDDDNFGRFETPIRVLLSLNNKVPPNTRKKVFLADRKGMTPQDWLVAVSAVADDSLDCIFTVMSEWRLEGMSKSHAAQSTSSPSRKRKAACL